MEEVWVVYLCLILMIIVLVLMKQNPHLEEARKERESKSSPPSSSFSPSNVGKQLEHTQEELEEYLERLNNVLFDTEARRRDGHHDQKSQHRRSADFVSETKKHSQHLSGYTEVQCQCPTVSQSTSWVSWELQHEAFSAEETLVSRMVPCSGIKRDFLVRKALL
ncbi:hypothetical protein BTVI_138347 [Pitangus sulphuratus]|nr:hypothetical protein BTVI_138347 [Pitangus sulphuratus]